MKIIIKPINSRFKRLIHDFGDQWIIVSDISPMHCFGGRNGITARSVRDAKMISNFIVDEVEFSLK